MSPSGLMAVWCISEDISSFCSPGHENSGSSLPSAGWEAALEDALSAPQDLGTASCGMSMKSGQPWAQMQGEIIRIYGPGAKALGVHHGPWCDRTELGEVSEASKQQQVLLRTWKLRRFWSCGPTAARP